MMIEHEDHDRTPDSLRTKLVVAALMALGAFSLASSMVSLFRQLTH